MQGYRDRHIRRGKHGIATRKTVLPAKITFPYSQRNSERIIQRGTPKNRSQTSSSEGGVVICSIFGSITQHYFQIIARRQIGKTQPVKTHAAALVICIQTLVPSSNHC